MLSEFGIIERNLKYLKGFPPSPTRYKYEPSSRREKNIGPRESMATARAAKIIIGEKIIINREATIISKNLLNTRPQPSRVVRLTSTIGIPTTSETSVRRTFTSNKSATYLKVI